LNSQCGNRVSAAPCQRVRKAGCAVLLHPDRFALRSFDYENPELVKKQLANLLQTVRHLKNNPAVLMWL
jgi:hypothetical protein